eukprot:CAMPEP_0113911848 /NCGR_PEP_ID=MMETSP0780_2-20120614/28503_1 /TAXON_ID=652834 /ORGANISM="Palpitomonas bilix" /LENGTH=298 /DNA_ID=CAMNT_0000908549 /DNA_START=162 /DNA_END=1055 /DNA_ORIENTATION=- /assembly_acc=CAM_ASM_000599
MTGFGSGARLLDFGKSSHPFEQTFYTDINPAEEPRGVNGPTFSKKSSGGANQNGWVWHKYENNDLRQGLFEHMTTKAERMETGENIAMLVQVKPKEKKSKSLYRSQHDPTRPPKSSFSGQYTPSRTSKGFFARTMGFQTSPTRPTDYLKRSASTLPEPLPFRYPDSRRKEALPVDAVRPASSLSRPSSQSTSDFVRLNASHLARVVEQKKKRREEGERRSKGKRSSQLGTAQYTERGREGVMPPRPHSVAGYRPVQAHLDRAAGQHAYPYPSPSPSPSLEVLEEREKAELVQNLKKKW